MLYCVHLESYSIMQNISRNEQTVGFVRSHSQSILCKTNVPVVRAALFCGLGTNLTPTKIFQLQSPIY